MARRVLKPLAPVLVGLVAVVLGWFAIGTSFAGPTGPGGVIGVESGGPGRSTSTPAPITPSPSVTPSVTPSPAPSVTPSEPPAAVPSETVVPSGTPAPSATPTEVPGSRPPAAPTPSRTKTGSPADCSSCI